MQKSAKFLCGVLKLLTMTMTLKNFYFRSKSFLCPEALYNIQKTSAWFLCEAQECGEFRSSAST